MHRSLGDTIQSSQVTIVHSSWTLTHGVSLMQITSSLNHDGLVLLLVFESPSVKPLGSSYRIRLFEDAKPLLESPPVAAPLFSLLDDAGVVPSSDRKCFFGRVLTFLFEEFGSSLEFARDSSILASLRDEL